MQSRAIRHSRVKPIFFLLNQFPEGEVDEGVEERGRVDGPLHDGLVALAVEAGDEPVEVEGHEAVLDLPVGHDVVDVEELVGGARGLVEEDEEEGDDGEPVVGSIVKFE